MRQAITISLNAPERRQLEQLKRGRRVAVRLAERAAIVLYAADGLENQEIGQLMGISRQKAGRWRQRYAERGLAGIEKDAPRPGRRRQIDARQRAAVVRKTLRETPEGQTHWSRSTMAAATGLSESTIGRIWREHGLKPHRVGTFKRSNDPKFVEKLEDIIGLYVSPPEHAVVLSCDEKSQIQALDRTQPGLPLKRGRCGTMTHDYKRNGTTDLFAALNVGTGEVLTATRKSHKASDVLAFFKWIDLHTPRDLEIHVVLDNLSAHKAPPVAEWLAHPKRARWHLHFTPTSSSWLNLVEGWFKLLTERRLRRGTFRSIDQLVDAIEIWVEHWNDDPKPFIWKKPAEEILTRVRRGRAALRTRADR